MLRFVALYLSAGFEACDLAAFNVFDTANRRPGGPFYEVAVVSAEGGMVPGSAGVMVDSRPYRDTAGAFDTVLVCGAIAHASRVARKPGTIFIGTGLTACADQALAVVEQDLGAEAARTVARMLMLHNRGSGAHAPSPALSHAAPEAGRIQAALRYARQNLRLPLSIDDLADQASMSRRHFTRRFRAETGKSPAKAIETMRAEAARVLIESTTLSLDAVARESGLNNAAQMCQVFARVYEQTPQSLRRTWPE
jgi:transcriptional regulator GlxA family with amidase domain